MRSEELAAELAVLRARLAAPLPPPHPLPEGTAAVLAPLVPTPHGVHVLLERRPPGPSPFAGQLSFPGGRLEPQDATPLDAALREAHEEVGFAPGDVEVLGPLTEMDNHLGRRVVAYVGFVPLGALPPRPASPLEVEELLLVPLGLLRAPGTSAGPKPGGALAGSYRVTSYESRLFAERAYTMHYWRLEPEANGAPAVLWGLTAEMTARLLAKAFGWRSPGTPRRVSSRADALP